MFELHGPEELCENGHGTAEERIGMHSLCSVQNHGLKNQVQILTVAMRHLFGGQLWESRCVFSGFLPYGVDLLRELIIRQMMLICSRLYH